EGLLGLLMGDLLRRYFNVIGAYIVCATVMAVAVYLSTTFSFAAAQIWFATRFAFAIALWQRFQDWRKARAEKRAQKLAQKLLEKDDRRSGKDRRSLFTLPHMAPKPAQAAVPGNSEIDDSSPVGNRAEPNALGLATAAGAEPAIVARADSA